ncbi:putative lipoprotein (plasmid) [Borrelia anserina Es]|nr:putative lipoprotein [Borrelia anserina Es]
MSVMINLSCIIIFWTVILSSCSVDKRDNISIRSSEDSLNTLLYSDNFDHNEIQKDKVDRHLSKDNKRRIKKNNTNRVHVGSGDKKVIEKEILNDNRRDQEILRVNILEVEKSDGLPIQDNILSSLVQYDVDHIGYIRKSIINDEFSESNVVSRTILRKDLIEIYKKRLKNNLNEKQKEALKFLEKALANKTNKLDSILILDEDEIKNMLDIVSKNLNSIKKFEPINELILDFNNLDDGKTSLKIVDEMRVEYTEVKNDINGGIEPSLEYYLSVINAHFNDDNIRSIVDSINSIEVLPFFFGFRFDENSLMRKD